MGRTAVDSFARFYVLPQTGHGLSGSSYTMDGDGRAIPAQQIPSRFDRIAMLLDWVERGTAPPKSGTATGTAGTLPLCSYPTYPRHNGGATTDAASYTCAEP
jgi:feruloyl esterase